ncbi:hypothetical protein HYZ98_05320 [Candidatus Peregrinibacteria bacterium]|nr:hypothetical protein [Candidatus Peregrinibacteria bacterium]
MNREWIQRWESLNKTHAMWGGGGIAIVLSMLLLGAHILEARKARDIGLPLATVVPDIEKRLNILEEQVELSRINMAINRGSQEEFVHVYVLPRDASMDRLVSSLEVLRDVLMEDGKLLGMTSIDIEGNIQEGEMTRWPVRFTVKVTEEGLRTVSLFLDIAGFFTVADVLTEQEIRQLFLYAESENPVSIIALEQFLSADLLKYTGEYQSLMGMVRKSFVSPAFDRLFTGLQEDSLLRDVRLLLGGPLGERLRRNNLWPLRFITVDAVTVTQGGAGILEAAFEISAYSRR